MLKIKHVIYCTDCRDTRVIFSKLPAQLINMFVKCLVTPDSRCHYAVILTCHSSLLICRGFPKDTGTALCFSPDLISSRSALQKV